MRDRDGMVIKHLPDHEGGGPVSNGLRGSTHVYNSAADVKQMLASLRAALRLPPRVASEGGDTGRLDVT